ncbi:MAG: hypothetical protein J3K34DRAFT_492679 [Monoraphidium minutum]|nr:MAG: hypothetical protein J3K34DRAFT_492679 [Monoraphidium minutum]
MSVAGSRAHRLLSQLVPVHQDEVLPTLLGFSSLFCLLASYFIVLPLREDAAIALGTSALPKLFILSLILALMVAPLVASFLNRQTARERDKSLRRLYCMLGAVQFVFYLIYAHGEVDTAAIPISTQQPWRAAAAPGVSAAGPGTPGAGGGGGGAGAAAAAAVGLGRVGEQAARLLAAGAQAPDDPHPIKTRRRRVLAAAAAPDAAAFVQERPATGSDAPEGGGGGGSEGAAAPGGGGSLGKAPQAPPRLTTGQAALRVLFYSWVSTYNLVAISSLWARCADVFSESGPRLFGFISAGATLGQLSGSVAALALASRARRAAAAAAAAGAAAPPALAPGSSRLVLVSAGLLFAAGQIAPRIRQHPHPQHPHPGEAAAPAAAPAPARAAAPPPPDAPPQEGAGPLRRRLSGNGAAALGAAPDGGGGGGRDVARVLRSASSGNCVAIAVSIGGGGSAPDLQTAAAPPPPPPPPPPGAAQPPRAPSRSGAAPSPAPAPAAAYEPPAPGGGGGGALRGVERPEAVRNVWSELAAGFRLILGSEYLLLVCAYLLMTYVVGSLLYFERALVVSRTLRGAGERTTFFAWLNSWSATLIALCQLFATASLLRGMGMPLALLSGPAVCLLGLGLIALRPSPSTIAGVEVVRKVVGYAIIRPAREVLFTVVSRQEKYSAKLVIDMVVQRAGDALAAGAFQLLDVQLALGVGGVAAAGAAACAAWLAAAARLGRVHEALARERRGGGPAAGQRHAKQGV